MVQRQGKKERPVDQEQELPRCESKADCKVFSDSWGLLFLILKMPLPWGHDVIARHSMNFLQSSFMSFYVRDEYEFFS